MNMKVKWSHRCKVWCKGKRFREQDQNCWWFWVTHRRRPGTESPSLLSNRRVTALKNCRVLSWRNRKLIREPLWPRKPSSHHNRPGSWWVDHSTSSPVYSRRSTLINLDIEAGSRPFRKWKVMHPIFPYKSSLSSNKLFAYNVHKVVGCLGVDLRGIGLWHWSSWGFAWRLITCKFIYRGVGSRGAVFELLKFKDNAVRWLRWEVEHQGAGN
jgi:hypothetical protein